MLKIIFNVIGGLILAGLLIAMLRAFDWDFIAMVTWIIEFLMSIVNTIADGFSNNDAFRNVVKK